MLYVVFWCPVIGFPVGLAALIFSRRIGAGILAGVAVSTAMGVLAFLAFIKVAGRLKYPGLLHTPLASQPFRRLKHARHPYTQATSSPNAGCTTDHPRG